MGFATVWKFPVPMNDAVVLLDLPVGAKVLHVGVQRQVRPEWAIDPEVDSEEVFLWALVSATPLMETERRYFRIVGTGITFDPDGAEYVGTFQLRGGQFVGPLFERTTPA